MPSRRVVLVGLSGLTAAVVADLALGGPGSGRGSPHRVPHAPAPSRPPDASEQAAATDERSLIAAYEQAVRTHPGLAATLALPLAHHRVHLAALTRTAAPVTAAPATTSASGPPPGPATVLVRRAALEALQAQEQAAAARRTAAATADLAGGALLAQIGASEAVHADYLGAAITALAPPAPPAGAVPTPQGR